MHRRIVGIEEPALEGVTGWIRSVFHFLSTPFVFLTYNIVGALAVIEMTYKGRDICGHTAAKKTALVASTTTKDASGLTTTAHGMSDDSGDSDSASEADDK